MVFNSVMLCNVFLFIYSPKMSVFIKNNVYLNSLAFYISVNDFLSLFPFMWYFYLIGVIFTKLLPV